MRDRYLFSADHKATEYRDVLELTPGHARLITPSAAARTLRWIMSIVYYLLYTAIVGAAILAVSIGVQAPTAFGWPAEVAAAVIWFAGLLAVGWAVDRQSLPLLADSPAEKTEIILEGARSFGTYQEVRARTMRGAQMKLIVDTRSRRFWEAVGLLEGRPAIPG